MSANQKGLRRILCQRRLHVRRRGAHPYYGGEDMAALALLGAMPRWPHIPLEFLDAMNAIFEEGVKGDRVAMDWKDLPRLTAANKTANLYIHMDAKEYAEVACNALILWWHFQRTKTAVTIVPGDDKESDDVG